MIEEGVNQIVGVKRNQMTVTRQVNQLTKELPLILGGMELFNQHLDKAQEVQVSPQKEAEVKAIKVHSNSDEEVFLMRDYVLSLQDPLCPLSGNKELLPPDSDVKQILNQQEKLEEEYDEYVTTMDLEAQNQMEEKIQEASCRYEEKLASLVNDYLFKIRIPSRNHRASRMIKIIKVQKKRFLNLSRVDGIRRKTCKNRHFYNTEP